MRHQEAIHFNQYLLQSKDLLTQCFSVRGNSLTLSLAQRGSGIRRTNVTYSKHCCCGKSKNNKSKERACCNRSVYLLTSLLFYVLKIGTFADNMYWYKSLAVLHIKNRRLRVFPKDRMRHTYW